MAHTMLFSEPGIKIEGLHLIKRSLHTDLRGRFSRVFDTHTMRQHGWFWPIAQINHSYTQNKGTIRGMHMQKPPHSEAKLITCLRGAVWDVAVDMRLGSPSFMHWCAVELSAENALSFLLPPGCAHGFQTLCDDVELLYCHSHDYTPEAEYGIHFQDSRLALPWPLDVRVLSEKDAGLAPLPTEFSGFPL